MENILVKKSSLRYPKERHVSLNNLRIKLKTNLHVHHGMEQKLKEDFLIPLKLPFESTCYKFSVTKISTCDNCSQTDLADTVNLENIVSKVENEKKLKVNVQLIDISLIKSHFDNITNKSENYMDFESIWYDVNKSKPHQVDNYYEFKIGSDCQSLLTFMKNINQKCSKNLIEEHEQSFPDKALYPVNRSSSSKNSKRGEVYKSKNFETYKKIVKEQPSTELKLAQNATGRLRIGIDRNLSLKYLTNNNQKLFITNRQNNSVEDPRISNFAKTLLSCLSSTQPKKRSIKSKPEYKMITEGVNENEDIDEINNLKTKIEEIKQQLPLNSPVDALLEICGPKSHITDMILNKNHQKKMAYKKSDSRFRIIRKLSNTDVLSQTNSTPDDEYLKLNFRNIGTPSSSKQSGRSCSSRPNSPYFEIDNFYMCNNSLENLKNEAHVSLKSNVHVIETLYNLHDNVASMENNLILFHQYICSIKSEISHLIYNHTCKQKNIGEFLNHIETESKKRNLSSSKCKEFYEKFCELESLSLKEKTKTKTQDSTDFPFKFQMALSAIFLIGFICGDFVKL